MIKGGAASSWSGGSRKTVVISLLYASCLLVTSLVADPVPDFDKTSLTLRTALHYDPSAQSPLQKLVDLYSAAGRTEELIALYTAHLAQYPQDANAKLVLARLYMLLQDKRAGELLKSAVSQHPDHALLIWQYALYLESQHDAKAVDEMARAVSVEKSTARRSFWFGELMKTVAVQGREDLLLTQTQQLIGESALSAEQRLRYARQATSLKLIKTADAMLQQINPETLSTDGSVELSLLQAEIMHAQGQAREAGLALDALLGRLAPEYWRRHEILMLRLDLSTTGERDALVEQARSRWLKNDGKTETNALVFADVLEAAHRSHESLMMLREAAQQLPLSRAIEARLLDSWDRDGVSEEALRWLFEKIKATPDREDLALRQVRWLFALNQSSKALSEWTQLMGILPEIQQVERSLELARWLRRRNQLAESSGVLEAVLQRASHRWDLRRELAELYLVQQRREDAAKLFAGDWSHELANDARLEISQFLLSKQWWAEAKAMLAPWLAQQTGAFDAFLLMARIHEKLGEDDQVELMLNKARALCDTDMRYQAWLTTAWDYAESRELQENWMEAESARLSAEVNDSNRETNFSRWVALIELAQSRQEGKPAEALLNKVMAMTALPEDKKQSLEKLKMEILSADISRATETEAGLRKLLNEDALHAEDYRLRLILFYQKMQRPDLTTELTNSLNVAKCTEAVPLRAVMTLFQSQGSVLPALACAERLTQLEQGDRAIWSQWMSLLVQAGREDQLRYAMRQVMGKAHEWNLKPEVLEDLRSHMLASHWRSMLQDINSGEDGWAKARRAATELVSLDLTPEQRRWTDWLMAFLSGKLGDAQAVQDALLKFKSLDEKQWIPFPDGMELSVAQGRIWLERVLQRQEPAPARSLHQGPLAPFSMQWGFAGKEDFVITKVLLSEDARFVYLCDDRHQIYALNCRTGKLCWTLNAMAGGSGGSAIKASRLTLSSFHTGRRGNRSYHNNGQPEISMPVVLVEANHRLCYAEGDQIVCLKSDTGELLWKSNLSSPSSDLPMANAPSAELALTPSQVVVWQSGVSVVSSLDLTSGKMTWQSRVPAPPVAVSNPNNGWGGYDPYAVLKASLDVHDGVIFVSHRGAALLRANDGTLLWRLSTENTPVFPIALNAADEGGGLSTTSVPAPMVVSSYSGSPNSAMLFQQMRGMNNQRWMYGSSIGSALQDYGAGHVMMHGDHLWSFGGNGMVDVSVMGLPVSQSSFNGTIVGFAGDSLISIDGQTVDVISWNKEAASKSLLSKRESDTISSTLEVDNSSVAISARRVYESSGNRLRAADVRNGTVLFDVSLPEEVKVWKKTFVKDAAPMSIPGYAMRQQVFNHRSYLPQGILIQDNQGGGILCQTTSVVTGDLWIFPVSGNGIVCVSGAPSETSATPATSP
ncbi:hypothetical protein BH11VER1_BH11VER1_41380 [soil metagenome]